MKKLNRVMDVTENNQIRNDFARVPDSDASACFKGSFWNPALNLQQTPLATSHLIFRDSLVRVLQRLRAFESPP